MYSSTRFTTTTTGPVSSPFMTAADAEQDKVEFAAGIRVLGENGCAAHASTRSTSAPPTHLPALLNLFAALVRGLAFSNLRVLFIDAYAECNEKGELRRLFELLFQTRDARNGKGERDLARDLFWRLFRLHPKLCISLLKHFPEFGYWKDLVQIAMTSIKEGHFHMIDVIVELFVAGLLSGNGLCGKWAPREGSIGDTIAKLIAAKMFPGVPKSAGLKSYRKLCAALNEKSKILETMLCTNRADEVEPSHIPSLAMKMNKLAILNEKKGTPLTTKQEDTGNRTTNPKRIELRRKLLRLLAEKGRSIKGARVFPHDLVREFMRAYGMSASSKLVNEAQWVTIREELAKGPGLGNKIALMDVSGSMSGTPMEVAIAIGILVSELTNPAFRDRVITFHESPTWVRFGSKDTLEQKVSTAMAAPWGCSTNFAAAMRMILKVCVDNKVRPEDVPGLIVLSDMQFDQADSGYATMHEQLVKLFAAAGYSMPQITYCNLRANTTGQPVKSDTRGTRLVSGWSPTILKLLASDDMSVTPMQTLFDALDDPRYDPIRVTLSGQLPGYFFTPPSEAGGSGAAACGWS
jgi:hypothetical protein